MDIDSFRAWMFVLVVAAAVTILILLLLAVGEITKPIRSEIFITTDV